MDHPVKSTQTLSPISIDMDVVDMDESSTPTATYRPDSTSTEEPEVLENLNFYNFARKAGIVHVERRRVGSNDLEHPPAIDNYRNSILIKKSRPTMKDLIHGDRSGKTIGSEMSPPETPFKDPEKGTSDEPADKLGWIEGVYLRCISNIFGIILYARLGWIAGQAGILYGSGTIILGFIVVMITAFSTSAICTNGIVKGGGSYYFISRSLGPQLGGSVGLLYVAANVVRAAMYVVGIGEAIIQFFGPHIIDGGINDIRLYSIASCILLLLIVRMGTVFESKIQVILVVMIGLSLIDFILGPLFPISTSQAARGMTGFKTATFVENLFPDYRFGYDFITVFAIYFPATTGIMAGANISGDLKNPGFAIPRGTILAIITTTLSYLAVLWITGSTMVRDSDGITAPILASALGGGGLDTMTSGLKQYIAPACAVNSTCSHGLVNYYQAVEMESLWGTIIQIGLFACTISSALNSFVSAPKIFQAICKDKIFPYVSIFGKGYGKNSEPYIGYAIMFVLTLAISLIGELNYVAPLVTNFYLCAFAMTNYACFDASYSRSPGFRPSFKFYNKWVSLIGAIMNVAMMFLISWQMALFTSSLFGIIWLYLNKRNPDVNWGTSIDANSYRTAYQNLIKLYRTAEHVKNYRPQILALTGNPLSRGPLVRLSNSISKGNSLLVFGDITNVNGFFKQTFRENRALGVTTIFSNISDDHETIKNQEILVRDWLVRNKVKGFYMMLLENENDLRKGAFTLEQVCGVGKLKPNILFLGYKGDWLKGNKENNINVNDYVGVIRDAFTNGIAVGIYRTNEKLETDEFSNKNRLPSGVSSNLSRNLSLHHLGRDLIKPVLKMTKSGFRSKSSDPTHVTKHQPVKKDRGTIDVWWMSDDGGLTLLIPYLLKQKKSHLEGAKLRIFTVAQTNEHELEQTKFIDMLDKFRISSSEVKVITNYNDAPKAESWVEFDKLSKPYRADSATAEGKLEIERQVYATSKHLRLSELLREHSSKAKLIVVTLPLPKKNISNHLYMCYLETISRDLPPTLMLRGNQTSVLTYYS